MELFKNVRRQVSSQLDQLKLNREIEMLSHQIQENPGNSDALRRLAEAHQAAGNVEAAITHFISLADLYQNSRQAELALAFYRKVERMVDSDNRATILKKMVAIYFSLGQFEKAYEHCRQIFSIYINNQQSEAASGFLKQLPPFGDKDADFRKELREMVQEKDDRWMQGARATWTEHAGTAGQPEDFSDRLVLLVDDEPHVLMILEKIIKPIGCQIATASNGVEALEKAKGQVPSLIISDLMMPKMDGSQLFAALQDDHVLRAVPFVCLTSRDQEEERVSAFEKGVEDYWGKPFSIKEIPARVKRLLRRAKPTKAIAGQLGATSLIDLLGQFEKEKRTGCLQLVNGRQDRGLVYFRDGAAVDAEIGERRALSAVFKMVGWRDGTYYFNLQNVPNEDTIRLNTADLILEALRRFDDEQDLIAALPDLAASATLPADFTMTAFAGMPPGQVRQLLMLVNGTRTLGDCVAELQGEVEMLRLLAALYSPEVRRSLKGGASLAVQPPPATETPLEVAPPSSFPGRGMPQESALNHPLGPPPTTSSGHSPLPNPYAAPYPGTPYTDRVYPPVFQPIPPPAPAARLSVDDGTLSLTLTDPRVEIAIVQKLYDAVITAKRQCGEPVDGFSLERFQAILTEQVGKIRSQANCVSVVFTVSIEHGRVKFLGRGL